MRISDHFLVFLFVGGRVGEPEEGGGNGMQRRVITEARIGQFANKVEEWDWREVRALGVEDNWARFSNEFRDMYDGAFPVVKGKKKSDMEKPWLDDVDFKGLEREKVELLSKKSN